MTEAQICARMREIRECRRFHHNRKKAEIKREACVESGTVAYRNGSRGSYKTALQFLSEYNSRDESTPLRYASTREIFADGKGAGYRKRANVSKGAHYTKSGGVTTKNRVTADGEVCGSVPKAITTKRFSNSRLTCVCKSRIY